MDKKYNILFLTSWYPNKTSPQAGNFIQRHALSVSEHCNVSVLHRVSRDQEEDFVIEKSNTNNVTEIIIYYKKITSKVPFLSDLRKFKTQLTAYKKGFKLILEEFKKIDLVHLNVTFPAGTFASHLYEKLKIPYIITEHWSGFLKDDPIKISFIEKYYIKKIARQAKVICPVSQDLKKAMIDFGIKNVYEVIPNVVNTAIFKPQKNENDSGKFGILHISNLHECKNITGILNTVKQLSIKRNDFRLTIAGNGDIEEFKQIAINLNIPEGIVHFEGTKTSEEVAELMNNNNLFLLFSNYESLPCVIAESLVLGLPVLATDVGGISEMINTENGVLVSPKNENELFQKLNHLIDNVANYDRLAIANKAKEIFNYKTVGKAYFSIYKSILDK